MRSEAVAIGEMSEPMYAHLVFSPTCPLYIVVASWGKHRLGVYRNSLLMEVFDRAIESLRGVLPDLGQSIAIDGTGIASWCNRWQKDLTDKEAGWGIMTKSTEVRG